MSTSLLAAQAPESGQRVHLHPLVLLTASDLITRHRVRELDGPLVGILLGQQQGTEITAEYAFTAKLKNGLLDQEEDWTARRIEQYKDVHKNPVLEVVGWFTLCPSDGPLPEHAILHKQLTNSYSESGILLAIHPTEFNAIQGTKGKLPISVYESLPEAEVQVNDGAMQVDGTEVGTIRFRPVPFVVETDETEMIAINYVAKGAGSAAAITNTTQSTSKKSLQSVDEEDEATSSDKKQDSGSQRAPLLTAEEEDQIAGMTTRLNSVKMLQERLQLLSRLVESVPPSYISDQSVPLSPSSPTTEHLTHLRNIQALLSRLALLTPAGQEEAEILREAGRAQANDVALTSVLSLLGQDIQGLSELGRKFVAVEQTKSSRTKGKGSLNQGAYGGMDDFDTRPGGALMDPGMYGI